MVRFSAICKWPQRSMMYVTFHSAELWVWAAWIASLLPSRQAQPGFVFPCLVVGMSTFPLHAGESYGMITHYVGAALQRRWGLMCVRYQDCVPRGVGSTADTLVSCQIDPLPSKTTILLLSLPTVNSPITVFFSPFCSPVSFDKCMQSCHHHSEDMEQFHYLRLISPSALPLPVVANPSAHQQPQAATRLAICYTF